jgi:hypothetical protein
VSAGKARLLEQYDKREAEVREAMQAAARASVELERATRYDETQPAAGRFIDNVYLLYMYYIYTRTGYTVRDQRSMDDILSIKIYKYIFFAYRVISSLRVLCFPSV